MVLLDIDGTLAEGIGRAAFPGAAEAVRALLDHYPVRYVTNATSCTRAALVARLEADGFPVEECPVVTPATLARSVLTGRDDTRGVLLCDPKAREDLAWFRETPPDEARAVLVATEAHRLRVGDLAGAVEALHSGATLYTLQQNRVFRRDGRLLTDLGPVAAFLGYAADVAWENLGKPSPLLFRTLAAESGIDPGHMVMVGDDAEFDCAGALRAGVGSAVLVRTGKYRPSDENRVPPPPTHVVDSIADLPALLAG
jgi:HAD superfamily hydrolase (TIGR01458 family)